MLESVKISRRQSEIRQALAGLAGKEKPDENEVRSMSELDAEYRVNETRYRAALIAEDQERRDAKGELETRGDREYADLVSRFEMRQIALALSEGAALNGPTNEVVTELRARGGYQGFPIPYAALDLERRVGETVAGGVYDPKVTHPVIDRIFADAAISRMGGQVINIDSGLHEWPVVTSSVSAGWAATETGAVAGPTVFATTDKSLAPNNTLGITMKVTRRALKQSGDALEQAIRRDMNSSINVELDKAAFLGAGTGGEPAGVMVGSYGITSTSLGAAASWTAFRAAVTRFLVANAANGPGDVKLLIRPEIYDAMDAVILTGSATSDWDRLMANIPQGNVVMSSNALAAPTGTPAASKALLAVSKNGVAPFFVATWGAIDLIRDPFSDAASGGLRLTGLVTSDVTVARPAQLEILTGLQ